MVAGHRSDQLEPVCMWIIFLKYLLSVIGIEYSIIHKYIYFSTVKPKYTTEIVIGVLFDAPIIT